MMNVLEHLRTSLVSFERQVETLHICGFFLALTVQHPRRMVRFRPPSIWIMPPAIQHPIGSVLPCWVYTKVTLGR